MMPEIIGAARRFRERNPYWRFGEDAFREVFFEDYDILEYERVIDGAGYPGHVCLGRKKG